MSVITGPEGGAAVKPVGTVWFAIATPEARGPEAVGARRQFAGYRGEVRRRSVGHALRLASRLLRAGHA